MRNGNRPRLPKGLSNASINKTIRHLAMILDTAVEYGYVVANAARGRRRRLPTNRPRRVVMTAEQLVAVLDAAGRRSIEHRTLLATAIMAGGLRVSELTGLRWRSVDLADGWLHVEDSKTEAGERRVDSLLT